MFDNNNLYVLNKKDRNALVYRDSMGTISRLTRDMFSSDEEFEYWKKWSDEDYHNEEEDSPEDLFFMSLSSLERTELCSILMEKFNSCLTATQRRRVWLHFVDGKTLREIAALEGATFLSIYESVKVAKNKILKNIKNIP